MKNGTKGRGAVSNPDNRYSELSRGDFDDGWDSIELPEAPLKTTLSVDRSRSAISYNKSPDVPFDRAVNPYRGCEHGCIYCYARPSHAWLGHSPGLDFESRLYHKPDIVELLRRELANKKYRCAPIALGSITDCYQPFERKLGLTRSALELLEQCRHPTLIITKSALVERDIDILRRMAGHQCIQVMISVTSLKPALSRRLEPRAASPRRRLQTIEKLHDAGIPVGVLVAPVIPVLTDPELEAILTAAADAGASHARWIMLRLPLEVAPLFGEWLQQHEPGQAQHVLNRVRDTRGGALYNADFSQRMRGSGDYARVLAQRFRLASNRLGFGESTELNGAGFIPPPGEDGQMVLL